MSRDPVKGVRNVGMYRLRRWIAARCSSTGSAKGRRGLRACHKTLGKHIPVAVALGGDPACIWAASAPLPPDIDEYLLAGWLRGKPVELVDCITQPLSVPAETDVIIRGPSSIPMTAARPFLTPASTARGPFPALRHRRHPAARPVYPARRRHSAGGDYWMGRPPTVVLPLLRLFLPEIVDFRYRAGLFHNLVLVSIRKRFPGHARKVMHGLWGLALLSLAKAVVIVDEWVDVQDPNIAAWQALGNVDWSRDVVISDGPTDHLDHASYHHSFGGKIGIDATRKWPEEGYTREWPEVVHMSPEVKARINTLWKDLGLNND